MNRFVNQITGVVVLASAFVGAQQPSPASKDPGLVLRVTTRMVLVDAVVLDKEGHPVKGLKPDDFTVTENGVRQRIASFSERDSERSHAAPRPVLPPHVTTNRPSVTQANAENGTVAVLLLDGLNTPPQDQIYVKQQMLKFLARQYDPNTRLAVFALTNKLTVLQSFTQDPLLLRAVLDRYLAQTPAVARSGGQTDIAPASVPPPINLPPQALGAPGGMGAPPLDPGLPATLAAGGANASIQEDIAYMTDRFQREAENFALDTRISQTLAALEEIARFMSGQSGRKVLLWFSTGFPFSVVGDSPSAMEAERDYGDQIRRTINLLNDAHIATYTIDAGGLVPSSTLGDPSISGRDPGKVVLGIDTNRTLATESFQRFSTHDAMETIARDTGGRYFNGNDLDQAIQSALKESSSYYMLGYYPSNKKWDGKFRNVKLQVDQPGTQLRYRRGYFAVSPTDWKKDNGDQTLTAALAGNSLPSTEVTFMARALPPQPDSDTVVEFAIDPSTLLFQSDSGNLQTESGNRAELGNRRNQSGNVQAESGTLHHCSLQLEVQAFTPDGKRVKTEMQTAEASLAEPTYEKVIKQEIPMSVHIRLAPGKYILRLGVRDNLTGLFGTADLLAEVPAKLESKR